MILLDTNVLIEFYKGNTTVVAELHNIGFGRMAYSDITKVAKIRQLKYKFHRGLLTARLKNLKISI